MKCTSCKTREPDGGKKTCQRCLDKAKRNRESRQARAREKMLCIRCSQPLDDIKYMACSRCRTAYKEQKQKLTQRRVSANLCHRCGKRPPTDFSALCQECYTRKHNERLARKQRLAESNLCQSCGKRQVIHVDLCQICLDRSSERHRNNRLERKRAGLCVSCGDRPAMPDRTACAECAPILRRYGLNHYIGGQERSEILDRDDNICQLCKRPNSLVVHHRDGSGKRDSPNHSPDNLITICRPCHSNLHSLALFCKDQKLLFILFNELMPVAE